MLRIRAHPRNACSIAFKDVLIILPAKDLIIFLPDTEEV